jgi:PAS domain S-box-containing protein
LLDLSTRRLRRSKAAEAAVGRFGARGFLAGGGASGAALRNLDWQHSPLGPPDRWPEPLKTIVSVMLGSNQAMVIVWGAERAVVYNDAFATLLGNTDTAALGRPLSEAWPDIEAPLAPLLDRGFAGEPACRDVEIVALRKGETDEACVSFFLAPVRDEAGEVGGVFCGCVEATERILAERRAALRAALDDRLRHLADPREMMAEAAAALGRHLGVGRCAYGEVDKTDAYLVIERDWTDGSMPGLVGTMPLAGCGAGVLAAFRAGQAVRTEDLDGPAAVAAGMRAGIGVPLIKNGRFVACFFAHQVAPRRWSDGDLELVRDLAERVWNAAERARAEIRLRELNAELEQRVAERTAELDRMWRLSPDLFGVFDTGGRLIAANPAWRRILGHDPKDVIGRHHAELKHPDDVAKGDEAFAKLRAGRTPAGFEDRYRHQDGSYRWISWTAVLEGDVVYAIGRDQTPEKERQAALEAMNEQLRQSQKMDAIGQLTEGVAHDFHNLLTAIRSAANLLRRPTLPDDQRARSIAAISATVDRAAKLTRQLLAFGRRQAPEPEVFAVPERIAGIVDMLGSILGSTTSIVFHAPATPCRVEADVSQFETAIVNMALNAKDAMAGEGVVVVRVEEVAPADGGRARVAVRVSDTGCGIAADSLGRIFEPFFTTKEPSKGTGLGLSQVMGFAAQSGGEVGVESEVGRGTTVTLYLPGVDGGEPAGAD